MARPHRLRVTTRPAPPATGHLPFADAPNAPDPIRVTSRWLTRGGRAWFPVSGEFHYSRYPAAEWEEELLKMKAGGVTAVASYLIWIHHEEAEGRVRFDGNRDLRRFAELCARHGLDFIPRIGPWSHAEVRGGGLPDWLLARDCTPRTDDPAYLEPVRGWFTAIAEQLRGLDRAHGGPVIAIQIENELYDQPGHLLTLKRMAQEAGLSAPLWTSTAWGGVQLPGDELFPLYGGYPEAFWTEADGGWPDTCRKHFFFTHQRDDEGIGADLRPTTVRGGDPDAFADRFPWATCELGGGMAVAYHRRPRLDAADIGALGLTKIGCGSVWQGYYMFHGGTNPAGELSTLQESHATGYPNDLPVLTYDFQAPLGEYGQYRPSYDELRLQHLMLADFGHLLAPMESVLPEVGPQGQHDRDTLRWAVRTDGASGFLFVNNHQPHEPLPDRPDTAFTVEFPGEAGALTLPSSPVTVPAGAYFCWPLRLDVAGIRLEWATAQPVCTVALDGRTVLVLAATDGIAPEFALDAGTVRSVSAPSGEVADVDGRILVTGLRPGTDALVEVDTADGGRVGLLVLDAATARTVYRGAAWGAERLVLCADGVVFDGGDEVRVHSTTARSSFAVLPAPARELAVDGEPVSGEADGILTRYSVVNEVSQALEASLTLVRPAGPAPEPSIGVLERASVPADEYFDTVAAEYRVDVPEDLPEGAVLRLRWTGDVGRAYVGDTLVADQFFAGRVWEIGRLPAGAALRVRVLPLHADAEVHVPGGAGDAARTAAVTHAEWVTGRAWAVRSG
ncbi:glycosyl hydrolase family 35 [Streptomyces viridochromogenes]|uniref:Glycosyl hydrolase family 35 n=1 Tax=Streptomyces viridochromogenes TaxID=1938 RepID=A0A0J7ZQ55_STRVR|nr:beta-galactosidase [Streptomyces viridochromogenes]KMS77288.1 glycosyl hydrolase family 35 [Streptomyces viridochromogenes]KOG19011.1 glycosyl hydrolase family 35 [Streptomyces viridochromogenes]KOG19250.1 glycosyl hydrolase family 35 [Streptomyces viridochromogenes]